MSEPLHVSVHAQYIRDLSFESPNAPHVFAPNEAMPALDMGINVQTRKLNESDHEVMLMLKLEAKMKDKVAFILELAYGGVFGLSGLSEEQARVFALVEAPRLLFPFARAIVADVVRDGGFPPVLLAPVDFAALYQQQQAQAKKPVNEA